MSYLTLLRAPSVARLLVGTLVGRLPGAMAALTISLALRRSGASYGFVGLAVGLLALSAALGGPLLGRLVDRVGQVRVLVSSSLAAAAGFVVLAVAPGVPGLVLAGAVLAGAASPPLEPCLRVLWPDLVPEPELESAYAMDSAAQELMFVVGPLAVAACTALASPIAALWASAVVVVGGVAVVVTAAPVRRWQAPARAADWLGPLRNPGLVILLGSLIGVGLGLGSLNVLVVSYAEGHRVPGGASALLALNAVGAMTGALAYGALRWSIRPQQRLLILVGGLTVGYALLCWEPGPWPMAGIMVLTGLFLAPVLTVTFVLVGELARPGTATEAFAWLVALITSGVAAGSAATGSALEYVGRPWAAGCGVLGVAACGLVLFAGRRRLEPESSARPLRESAAVHGG